MLLVPGTFLFANVRFGTSSEDRPQIPATALALPLLATALAIALCHMVPSEPRRVISVPENSLYLLRDKPLFTIPLSFFMTFGPVIALVLYDWRTVRDVVSKHAYLVVFLGGCFLTSYIGGHENERYLLWAAPVMYLLIALALQRYGAILMRSAWVFVILAGAQALAEHIFFGIPDPSLAVGDWSYLTTFSQKTWGVVNRLLVVDDFSWNLWSYFGSRPFHVLLLAIYIAFSASLIAYLRWAERPRLIDTSR
jgi:hypothetical protein